MVSFNDFLKGESGNITLWILYVASMTLVVAVWIIVYNIVFTAIFPLAVSTGADTARPYTYMVMFFKWFPLLPIFGYSFYVINNAQKPDRGFA